MESAISDSVTNRKFCVPKATGKTEGILDSKTASEVTSKLKIKFFLGGEGVTDQICAPPSQKSSYAYDETILDVTSFHTGTWKDTEAVQELVD